MLYSYYKVNNKRLIKRPKEYKIMREEKEQPIHQGSVLPIDRHTQDSPAIVRSIYGSLPEGRELVHPLSVVVEHDDDEFVVSEPRFHMHASASTEAEAIAAFRRVLSGYLDVLEEQEAKLGPSLQTQLTYLRSMIKAS